MEAYNPSAYVKPETIAALVASASKKLPAERVATFDELKKAINAALNGASVKLKPAQRSNAWHMVHAELSRIGRERSNAIRRAS